MNETNKEFEKMSRDDQINMAKQISDIATECDIKNLKVQLYSETVCQLFTEKPSVTPKNVLRAEKELPATDQEKVDAFNAKVKPIIEGVKGVSVSIKAKLGAGDMYKTIKNVIPFEGDDAVEITHTEG